MRKFLVPFGFALPLLTLAAQAETPSFDCGRAQKPFEIAICQTPELAEADRLISKSFNKLPPGDPQRRWVRTNNIFREDCGSDPVCILDIQTQALNMLATGPEGYKTADRFKARVEEMQRQKLGRKWQADLPMTVGDCRSTRITDIADRFGENINKSTESGSSVDFRNGGHQVSYDKEGPLMRSRVGDMVKMCLSSIPKDCPPGDDRGRTYKVENLRTGEKWDLPDAQHMCGGA
jgi:uncharacterized protein